MEVCYRHPDRETGVSCSNCGRPICPDCMTTTQVGMRCPECSQERTKVVRPRAARVGSPVLTYILIGINAAVAVGVEFGGTPTPYGGIGFGSPLQALGVLYGPFVAEGEWWRIITSGFLHAGFGHLFVNMFSLYVLGLILEPAVGRLRFGVIYFVSLISGSFGALLLSPMSPTVGASGAVFGLMGAAFVVMRRRGINPMENGLALWMGINLVITFVLPGLSIGGHLGGLAGGILPAAAIYEVGERSRNAQLGMGLAVLVGSVAAVGAVLVA
jgi:membrane associated rhomboid family serine protease